VSLRETLPQSRHKFAIRPGVHPRMPASSSILMFKRGPGRPRRCELPSNSPKLPDENVLAAPVRSCWLGLVAGRTGEPHPVSPDVRGAIEDGKVTLTGTVENEGELTALQDQVKEFQHELFETFDNQLTVKPDDSDVSGILSQTIVAL